MFLVTIVLGYFVTGFLFSKWMRTGSGEETLFVTLGWPIFFIVHLLLAIADGISYLYGQRGT
jgi:hypothetical protein